VASEYTVHVLCYRLPPRDDENVPILQTGLLFTEDGEASTVIALLDSTAHQREQAAEAYAFDKRLNKAATDNLRWVQYSRV